MNTIYRLLRSLSDPSARNRRLITAAFAVLGFCAPALYGLYAGWPTAIVHDEFGYLLSADTFAQGRLTNPTPAAWESFEAPYILLQPTYISKYPPAQSLFLAAGQVVFGDPAFGIWLSCGFASASLFWMLCVWTRQPWAIAGTVIMILLLGVFHYWAQSFWGGMVASGGGSLFFGAFRRLLRRPTVATSLLMTLGGVILLNSRPYEGTASMTLPLVVLFVWFFWSKRHSISFKFSNVVLPGVAMAGLAISLMAYNNFAVTGNAFRFPYAEHHAKYVTQPLFLFEDRRPPTQPTSNRRLQELYDDVSVPDSSKGLVRWGLPDRTAFRMAYAFAHRLVFLPLSFLTPGLGVFFFLAVILFFRHPWMRIIAGSIVVMIAAESLVSYWNYLHYAAPVTCCFFLVTTEGFRLILRRLRTRRTAVAAVVVSVAVVSVIVSVVHQSRAVPASVARAHGIDLEQTIDLDESIRMEIPERLTFVRRMIENYTHGNTAKKYLVLVSYDSDHSMHDEITFNPADLNAATVIWASDLGREKNQVLFDAYRDRKIVNLRVNGSSLTIKSIRDSMH